MKVVRKTAQMCSWGISSAARTTTSCSTASGSEMKQNTNMKCGHTNFNERRKASGTEASSRLMRGPTRANRVPTIRPGMMKNKEVTAPMTTRIASAANRRSQGKLRSTANTGWAGSPRSTEPTRRSSMPA